MLKVLGVLLLGVFVTAGSENDAVIDGTDLVLVFMVHRHGDRTPIPSTVAFSNDPEALTALSAQYGWGQLTNAGKQRAYELGKDIRSRYQDVLPQQYNLSDIYLRATDSTRAKMTVLTSMAAVFPPDDESWSTKIDWQPAPYTTVPLRYDFNAAFLNCPTYVNAYTSALTARPEYMRQYSDILTLLTSKIGSIDLNQYPVMVLGVYDLYLSQLSLGLPLDPEIQDRLNEVKDAADTAADAIYGVEENIPYQAGVLLNEFYNYARSVIAGNETQSVRIYSAHDFNVYSLQAVSAVSERQGVPPYASSFTLELRRVRETGQYVVIPVYVASPGDSPRYLTVSGCDDQCDFEDFVNITSQFALDYDTWREECAYTPDLVIDESSVN